VEFITCTVWGHQRPPSGHRAGWVAVSLLPFEYFTEA
jgi:hypothetical protein